MLAPIALYPDQLLTQMLMAATFPDQLVEARKWLDDSNNASLKGDDLANALQPLPWDPSVKSLASFPQIISMMVDHLDWTEALGVAFANQQVEVFARVQFLRDRAVHAGKLKSTPQLAVREEASDIIIEPVDPEQIYVPVYNPAEIYGPWPDHDAPPVYIPPPPRLYSGAVGAAIGFSVGLAVAKPLWGWGHPDWRRHEVVIDRNRYESITNQTSIEQHRVNIEGGAWRRAGPVAIVPEAQRPRPVQVQEQQLPPGTVRPSEVPPPRAPRGGPPDGQQPAERGQPGARPGEHAQPQEAHPGGPPPRPQEAQPGARPGEPPRPQEAHPNGAPPHPPDQQPATRTGEPHPGAAPSAPPPPQQRHPQESHPAEQHAPPAPPQQPHPPEEHAPPQQERAAPPQHPPSPPPEPHPAPPQQQPPPHPQPSPAPPQQPPHPAPPPQPQAQPQPPHPQGPPPQAHPAPPQQKSGPPPQEHKGKPEEQQQQQQH
jgi:hypothetical protein